jgi:oligopeptidase B
MQIPSCPIHPTKLLKHGDERIDNYFWLNERDHPDVITYLESENKYAEVYFEDTQVLQNEIYEEIIGRMDKNETSVPVLKDGYYYLQRYQEGGEYPIFSRSVEEHGEQEILLDVNVLAERQSYCAPGKLQVCPNNELLAYSVDFVSRRLYTIHFKNLKTGELLQDEIPSTSGGFAWASDGKTIFYTQKDEQTLRSYQIKKHVLGTAVEEDEVIFTEEDDTFIVSVSNSKSKEYIVIGSYSTVSSEIRVLPADLSKNDFEVICPRERDHEYSIFHFKDRFYILTNWKAKNFRLMKTKVNALDRSNWEEVIAHREDVLLEGLDVFEDHLVLDERKNGLTNFRVIQQSSGKEYYIDLMEESYMAYSGSNASFDTTTFRFVFTSMKTPSTVYDFDLNTREKVVKKQQKVIGGHNPEDYITKRIWTTVRDGVQVPMSVVHHKSVQLDGSAPALLYGYGSYGHVVDPTFSSARLSLLQRGFVFAIAHIRGGEDLGRVWYEEGKLLRKLNTFYDFIDCGKKLVELGYSSKDKLCAMGGSAGGMLMGGIINMAPELWRAVIAAVPFVDVVTTMLDDSIPLTTGEYDEWGNPNEEEYYHYMKSYSPYDNIEEKEYPALLVTTGYHDSQVQYWEPAKWVAKLRTHKKDKNPLLFKTNMEAGHGGASGRYEYHRETALQYAFLLKETK